MNMVRKSEPLLTFSYVTFGDAIGQTTKSNQLGMNGCELLQEEIRSKLHLTTMISPNMKGLRLLVIGFQHLSKERVSSYSKLTSDFIRYSAYPIQLYNQ